MQNSSRIEGSAHCENHFDYKAAGQRLGLAADTVRKAVREGRIRAVKFGRSVRIPESELARVSREGW